MQVWVRRVQLKLVQGNTCGVSRTLGIMAHMAGDVAQPMHTDGSSALEGAVLSSFERAVDTRCTAASCIYQMHFDGRDVVDPFAVVVATARAAHPFYFPLINEYERHGYNDAVDRIARRQLDRAADEVADLLWSLVV